MTLALSGVLALLLASNAVADQGEEIRKAATAAWKEQQTKAGHVRVKWTATKLIRKGAITSVEGVKDPNTNKVLPFQDYQETCPVTLVLAGGRFAYSTAYSTWLFDSSKWVKKTYTYSYTGEHIYQLSWLQGQSPPNQFSSKRTTERPTDLKGLELKPITMTVRGADPEDRVADLDEFQLTNTDVQVNGAKCVEFRHRNPRTKNEVHILMSALYNYMPVRTIELFTKGPIKSIQTDIWYHLLADRGLWVPSRWKCVTLDRDGQLHTSREVRDVVFTFEVSIPDKEFNLTAPSKSVVLHTSPEGIPESQQITRSDGSFREVLPGESRFSYSQLESTEPGELTGGSGRPFQYLRWAALSILVLIVCGLMTIVARKCYAKRRGRH